MSILNRSYSSSGAGRAFATVYQNTSATYPLIVQVHNQQTGGGGSLQGEIGPTNTVGDVRFLELPTANTGGGACHNVCFFFVPPLYYYKVTGGTMIWWQEYQVLTGTLSDSGDLGPSGANTRTLGGGPYTNSGTNGIVVLAVITGLSASGNNNAGTSNGGAVYKVDYDAGGIGSVNFFATQTVRLFVPAGATYQITTTGGTLSKWHEYDIGCSFTDAGDQTTRFALNNVTQNTGTAPWLVEIPYTFTSGGFSGGIELDTDSSNPPTSNTAGQWKRDAGFGQFGTITGVVMPSEYVKTVYTNGGGGGSVAISGSPRLYSLGGIPFASVPLMTYQNP